MTRTAVYLRKSRAEELSCDSARSGCESPQGKSSVDETLRRHREILMDYARKEGLSVLEIYEEVISGENLFVRTEMLRLLSDAEAGKYDAVLCMDIDRLGRGAMSQQGIILETLKNAGVKIITPRRIYDLNNEQDEEYTEFQSFFARRELKTIKRRMRQGVVKTAQEGGYLPNAPYGYEKCRRGKLPSLAVVEEEARFVRMMFSLYAEEGCGCQTVADRINALGARPRRGGAFSRSTVAAILKNPVYTGEILWNRGSAFPYGTSSDGQILVSGIHPPLVSRTLFDRAQAIFREKGHPPRTQGELVNPLAGILYCAVCGSRLQYRRDRRGQGKYLLCPRAGCMPALPFDSVEELIHLAVKEPLSHILISVPEEPREPSGRLPAMACREIRKTQSQLTHICELLEQGVYTPELFRQRQAALEEKLRLLEKMRTEHPESPGISALTPDSPPVSLWELFLRASPAQQNAILKELSLHAECYKGKRWTKGQFLLSVRYSAP